MIVGIDVYHEGKQLLTSIVGIVASMNETFSKYFSMTLNQKNTRQEVSCGMRLVFTKILKAYKDVSFCYEYFKHNNE